MKKIYLVWFLFLFTITAFYGIEMEGQVRVEMAQQGLNLMSTSNLNNMHEYNTFDTYLRANVLFKTEMADIATGYLNLQAESSPLSFKTIKYGTDLGLENVFVKGLYIDIEHELFMLSVGKKYLDWGQGSFFYPLDIMNAERDLLRPKEEVEGSPLVSFTLPFYELFDRDGTFAIDLIGKLDMEERGDTTILNFPLVPRISYSDENINFFAFSMLQLNKLPSFGGSLGILVDSLDFMSFRVYGEVGYKGFTDRIQITKYDTEEPLAGDYFFSYMAGADIILYFDDLEILEGINLKAEYYSDGENWTQGEYQAYLGYLDKLRVDELFEDYYAARVLGEGFRNSRFYLFSDVTAESLFLEDLDVGAELIMNLEDSSMMLMPELSYSFGDEYLSTGIKGFFLFGDGKPEGDEIPVVEERSEFGTALINHKIMIYVDVFIES